MTILSGSIQNLLLYITTILIWGSSWLAIKLQLGYVDPMVSVAYRFILASGISWIYCSYSGRLMRFGLRDHLLMLLQGVSLFSLNYLLFYISEITLTSGLAAIIFQHEFRHLLGGLYLNYCAKLLSTDQLSESITSGLEQNLNNNVPIEHISNLLADYDVGDSIDVYLSKRHKCY